MNWPERISSILRGLAAIALVGIVVWGFFDFDRAATALFYLVVTCLGLMLLAGVFVLLLHGVMLIVAGVTGQDWY